MRGIIFARREAEMEPSIRLRTTAFLLMLLAGVMGGAALAADPNIDPVLPDPVPSGHPFPPAMATAGTGDPGPELHASPVSAAMLAGRGRGCDLTSPCAVNSPPLMIVAPVAPSKPAHAQDKTGAGG
jgi:hypothetical protein